MKRTNKLFNVQVAMYAWIAVEADNEEEAKELVQEMSESMYMDDYFDDSEVEVESVEDEVYSAKDVCSDKIWTSDGVMTKKEYKKAMKGGAE